MRHFHSHRREGAGSRKTLDRALSRAGVASRTEVAGLIRAGRVTVNGRAVVDPGAWVDPERDRVALDGKPVRSAARRYLALHKPVGYVTTRRDPEGRRTVYDLLGAVRGWVAPVGRLDRRTSGLLLLTNDTTFSDRVTDPRSHLPKTYLVKTNSRLADGQIDQLRRGVRLSDGPARPAVVRLRGAGGSHSLLEIVLTEGRNQQVRRMLRAVGSKVVRLKRISIGPLILGGLRSGAWRELSSSEIKALNESAT
jgi:pseudouridine synthase